MLGKLEAIASLEAQGFTKTAQQLLRELTDPTSDFGGQRFEERMSRLAEIELWGESILQLDRKYNYDNNSY